MSDLPIDYQQRFDAIWDHEPYETYAFEPLMMKKIVQLARRLGAKRILSVGCGQALGVKELLDEGFDAYGVDVSQVALDKQADDPALKERLVRADFTKVTEPLFGSMDLVYSVSTLQTIHPLDLDAFFNDQRVVRFLWPVQPTQQAVLEILIRSFTESLWVLDDHASDSAILEKRRPHLLGG